MTSTPAPYEFYASCPEGFEDDLADELRDLGLRQVRRLKGRVTFVGQPRDAYRACLWSRLASRIFVLIERIGCANADDLYDNARTIPWERVLRPGARIAIVANGTNDALRNTHFSALCVKDALCDRLPEVSGRRPDIDVENPDARIQLSVRGERASLHLDLTGDPLFKRLPREATQASAAHVLRPDYAALILAQGGWQRICASALANNREEPAGENEGALGKQVAAGARHIGAQDTPTDEQSIHTARPADTTAATASEPAALAAAPAPTFPILIDLCCAGGGIALEAASILADRAPGLSRTVWGFQGWAQHDARAWRQLVREAQAREQEARSRAARIVATDPSSDATALARRVLKAAGLDRRVIFCQPNAEAIARKLSIPTAGGAKARGIMAADLLDVPLTKLPRTFSLMADMRSGVCLPGHFGELVADTLQSLPLITLARDSLTPPVCTKAATQRHVRPNNEDAFIARFVSFGEQEQLARETGSATPGAEASAVPAVRSRANERATDATIDLGDGTPCPVLIPESEQFARRLRKVAKQRRKWAQREGVTCYRIYDADLPDYAAAIDLYEGSSTTPGCWLVIAEYAAPRQVDPALAQARLLDILTIAPRILGIAPENVFAKARIRSRGGSQYGKGSGGINAAERNRGGTHGKRSAGRTKTSGPHAAQVQPAPADIRTRRLPLIEEGGLTFAVNFNDYLDTGIFLDHRITRGLVREHAKGRRWFLNLFAYTGTATCYAADAGVEETVTVDLSNTYLDWAERNMEQNGFTGPEHHFVRADVLAWIEDMRHTNNRWDLIFCDPPTFSNSSKMGQRTWDVQRDHVELLVGLSRLLTHDGEAIFSCNLRTFRPDTAALEAAGVALTDITPETIPEDFARNPRIHRCYIVRRTR